MKESKNGAIHPLSLESYARALPKVELHVHLEGSIRPATLLTLAKRNGVALPAEDVEGLRRWFVYRDFDHFVEIFVTACRCLRGAEDFELVAYEFGAEMARQNVRYAEVTVSPSTHYANGVPQETWFTGIERGRARARADFGVEMAWIFNIVRRWQIAERLRPFADYTTGVAIDGRHDGVIALGLAGAEAGAPPEPFAPWFDRARAAGLHSAPHAGEHMGPASVWGALRALGAERIGHGARSIEDAALVAHLAARGIPLELCPHSNVCLGVCAALNDHPLPRLHAAGVTVTVNSDDPPLFNTNLCDNVAALVQPFGLDAAAIDQILLNGIHASFLPPERKQALVDGFEREAATLKMVHLAGET